MHNKKRLVPSEPSPHVIFLGLDPDFTESDVSLSSTYPLCPQLSCQLSPPDARSMPQFVYQMQAYLTSNSCSIESVTIIRDRSTGTCPILLNCVPQCIDDLFSFAPSRIDCRAA